MFEEKTANPRYFPCIRCYFSSCTCTSYAQYVCVRVEKLLGVNINQNVSLKPHTDKVHETISMIHARFRQIKPFLPIDARINFCQAFVFPHLGYCSCIWGSAQLGRLFKLQKRAARIIYDLPTRTPTTPLFKKLGWMPLTDRVQYMKSLMVYNSFKGLALQYMAEMYKFVHDVSRRVTRHSDKTKLYLARGSHIKVYSDSFQFSSTEAWNRLPAHVRESQYIGVFNPQYYKWRPP